LVKCFLEAFPIIVKFVYFVANFFSLLLSHQGTKKKIAIIYKTRGFQPNLIRIVDFLLEINEKAPERYNNPLKAL